MKLNTFRPLIAALAFTILSACGGGNDSPGAALPPSQQLAHPVTAGDCADAACTPPMVDGLAEEFRSRALNRQHDGDGDDEAAQPVYPRVPDQVATGPDPAPRP
jgi:hypothetical protein